MNRRKFLTAKLATLLLILLLSSTVVPVSAHSGRTDANGGHNCYVGACAGTYHYHNGGNSPPYSTPEETPAPRQPIISTKTVATDESIPFQTKTVKTKSEYRGYKKVQKVGIAGIKRVYIEISLTDGSETSRKIAKTEIVKPAENAVELIGIRKKPEAKVKAITRTNDKNKFNISGTAKKNTEIVLSVDGKRIKRTKTNTKGQFRFNSIKLGAAKAKIQIYNRIGGKESPISEKSTVNVSTAQYKTEYSEKLP